VEEERGGFGRTLIQTIPMEAGNKGGGGGGDTEGERSYLKSPIPTKRRKSRSQSLIGKGGTRLNNLGLGKGGNK